MLEDIKIAIFKFEDMLVNKNTIMFLLKEYKKVKRKTIRYYYIYIIIYIKYLKYKLRIISKYNKECFIKDTYKYFISIFNNNKINKILYLNLNVNLINELVKVKEEGYKIVLISLLDQKLIKNIFHNVDIDLILESEVFLFNNKYLFKFNNDEDIIYKING